MLTPLFVTSNGMLSFFHDDRKVLPEVSEKLFQYLYDSWYQVVHCTTIATNTSIARQVLPGTISPV